jgi:tetratricopeptide (TPR) repeat protein
MESADPCGQLYFIAGELYLAPEHPFHARASEWLGRNAPRTHETATPRSAEDEDLYEEESEGHEARQQARVLARELLQVLVPCGDQFCRFVEGAAQIRVDLVGPLPTAQLIMEAAVQGKGEQQILRELGGSEALLVAVPMDETLPRTVGLDPDEAFLLTRLESPLTLGNLLNQLEVPRTKTLERLRRLQALDLVRSKPGTGRGVEEASVGAQLMQRLEQRIGESLTRDPLILGVEEHRQLLGGLMRRLGEMTYFDLLGVGPQSTVEEVHRAFMELGRMVHPSHGERLGLTGGEAGLRLLFERATEAYFTLSDADRRIRYVHEVEPATKQRVHETPNEERVEELKLVARKNFELAQRKAERRELHAAIQLLEQAVKVDHQPEYYELLADCQIENPKWYDRAAVNYTKAARLRPGDASLRLRLGRVYERLGNPGRAREHFHAALTLDPELSEAKSALQRVGGPVKRPARPGLFERLRSMLTGE